MNSRLTFCQLCRRFANTVEVIEYCRFLALNVFNDAFDRYGNFYVDNWAKADYTILKHGGYVKYLISDKSVLAVASSQCSKEAFS